MKSAATRTRRAQRRSSKQFDLFNKSSEHGPGRKSHGGDLGWRKRKLMRPLHRKHPLLLTMRASIAVGRLSLLNAKHRLRIKALITAEARKSQVTLHRFANVGNHLHIKLSFNARDEFQNFLRTISCLIARLVTGAKKGQPFGTKFWDRLAHTRVLSSRREAMMAERYVEGNEIEAALGRKARASFFASPQKYRERNRARMMAAGVQPGSS